MKLIAAGCFAIVALGIGQGQNARANIYVPDEQTAVKIAEAVLTPVYGGRQIASERPFQAKLDGDEWTVSGTLRCPNGKGGVTTMCAGGVAIVHISKLDARILSMSHGK